MYLMRLEMKRVQLEPGGPAGDAGGALAIAKLPSSMPARPGDAVAIDVGEVRACTWPGGGFGVARVHRLADAEAGFETGHPGGLGRDRDTDS